MDFQLVLQFREELISGYEAMKALEDEVADVLDDTEELDGHDFGLNTANLFILTANPAVTFQRLKPLLERTGRLAGVSAAYRAVGVSAAYRAVDNEPYKVLWPADGGGAGIF